MKGIEKLALFSDGNNLHRKKSFMVAKKPYNTAQQVNYMNILKYTKIEETYLNLTIHRC